MKALDHGKGPFRTIHRIRQRTVAEPLKKRRYRHSLTPIFLSRTHGIQTHAALPRAAIDTIALNGLLRGGYHQLTPIRNHEPEL